MNPPTSNPQFLTIEEKRAWLAHIFRDTNLALISEKQEIKPAVNRNLREENPCISEDPCYIEPVSGRSAVSLNETENQALS